MFRRFGFSQLNTSFFKVVVLLTIATLVLTACASPTTEASKAAAAATTAPTANPKADWPAKFVIGFFAGDDPTKVLNSYESLRAYLESKLGVKVELVTGTSYSAVIEAMRVKKADAMEVGPFSYTLAVQEAKAEALVVSINGNTKDPKYDAAISPFYYSVIFTKKGANIATLNDLKGKDFTFVDPASTSGHLMPKTLLLKNGINPDKDMKTVFAGSHPSSVLAVWNDKSPAGATYEQNIFDLNTQGQVKLCYFKDNALYKSRTPTEIKALYDECPKGNLVVIAYSDPIPATPFAVRSDLPASFKAELKAALLDVKNRPEIIAKINEWYVDPTQEFKLKNLDNFYDILRDAAKLLDLDLAKMK
jgi:phosphonate transport system substrate-binding protein